MIVSSLQNPNQIYKTLVVDSDDLDMGFSFNTPSLTVLKNHIYRDTFGYDVVVFREKNGDLLVLKSSAPFSDLSFGFGNITKTF